MIQSGNIPEQLDSGNTEYQKRFRIVWMEDPKFRSWLLPVRNELEKFNCIFCDSNYIGGKSEINKHSKSTKHQKMVALVNANEELRRQYKLYVDRFRSELKETDYYEEHNRTEPGSGFKFRFRDEFLLEPDLKDWLLKVEDLEKFGCKFCDSEYSGGKWEMKKHAKSLKHQKNAGELTTENTYQSDTEIAEMLVESPISEEAKEFQTEWLFDVDERSEAENPLKNIDIQLCYKNVDILGICRNLLENPYDFDVLIYTNGKILKAHRLILASCSFFRTIFNSSVHFEIENVIKVHLPDFRSETVELLLKLFYTGEVSIKQDLVEEFQYLLKSLNIDELADKLMNPMEQEANFEEVASTSFHPDHRFPQKDEESEKYQEEERDQEEENENILFDNSDILYEEVQTDQHSNLIYFSDEEESSLRTDHNSRDISEPSPKRPRFLPTSPQKVEKLRNEFSKFKDRLTRAINYYRNFGGILVDVSRKFEVPLEVLKRNIKGIEVR